MFNTELKKCLGYDALFEALTLLKPKSSGLDRESLKAFKVKASRNITQLEYELLDGSYTPEPIKKIEIAKDAHSSRPIAISSVRDKVVQRALVSAIEPYFDELMSNRSYGYP
jgi:retron-type reverse transcriptase